MLTSFLSETPTALEFIVLAAIALVGGVAFSILYAFLKKKDGYYKDMVIAYAIFPFLVTSAILGVTILTASFDGTELMSRFGRVGVALLSAVIVLRFRSEQRNFEDLTYMLFLTIFAFILGIGYIGFSLIIYFVVILVFILFYVLKFPHVDHNQVMVSITVPENLNYPDAFADVFNKYCTDAKLTNVKTADLGSVFIVKYQVNMKKDANQKEFIDALRERNSNLNITLSVADFKGYKE